MYDIIIVGAGPAGLTAAIYGRRAEKKILVLEAISYGGQIINTVDIENYPVEAHISGFDFATKLYDQVKELKAEVIFEKVVEVKDQKEYKEVITTKNTYQSKTVILATGNEARRLGLPMERELIGKGISYCATCDGAFYKGKEVAVQGGGNTAIEDALYLADLAKTVYLIHRRETFRADEKVLNKLKTKENVVFLLNSTVTKLNAKETLESIEVTNLDRSKRTIEVSALFVAIGRIPENENFRTLVDMDESGYIIAKEDCHTNIEGIFVAGDTRTKSLRQLVTATSDGAIAATEAIKYMNHM